MVTKPGPSMPSLSPASEWVAVNTRPVMVTQQTVRNLALGDKFFLRVAAVSSAGAGPPAVLEQPIHIQQIIGKAHPFLSCPPARPRHLDRWANGRRKEDRHLPVPPGTCTSRTLSPPCLQKVPGSSAASLRRSKRPSAQGAQSRALGEGLPDPQK